MQKVWGDVFIKPHRIMGFEYGKSFLSFGVDLTQNGRMAANFSSDGWAFHISRSKCCLWVSVMRVCILTGHNLTSWGQKHVLGRHFSFIWMCYWWFLWRAGVIVTASDLQQFFWLQARVLARRHCIVASAGYLLNSLGSTTSFYLSLSVTYT